MGKSSLIIVLGMSVIIGFFILRLNANSKENVATTVNMFEQTHARLIANSGVEIYLEKLKHDLSLANHTYSNNNLFEGTYNVSISEINTDGVVTVTSNSNFMDVNHTTVVEAYADKLPIPPLPGALYLSTSVLHKMKITGNITISGLNHELDGSLTTALNDDITGIAVDSLSQVAQIESSMQGACEVEGVPPVGVVDKEITWEDYSLDAANNADITITPETNIAKLNTLGTITEPKTTLVKAGDKGVKFNQNLSGCGILVVDGSLTINGTFDYWGIIIAYKETDIEINFMGNSTIYGGILVTGNTIKLDIASGNFDLLYSSAALNLLQGLLQTQRFKVLSWWE